MLLDKRIILYYNIPMCVCMCRVGSSTAVTWSKSSSSSSRTNVTVDKTLKYLLYTQQRAAHIMHTRITHNIGKCAYSATAKRGKKRRHVGRGGSDVCRGACILAVYISRGKTIYILTSFVRARVHVL